MVSLGELKRTILGEKKMQEAMKVQYAGSLMHLQSKGFPKVAQLLNQFHAQIEDRIKHVQVLSGNIETWRDLSHNITVGLAFIVKRIKLRDEHLRIIRQIDVLQKQAAQMRSNIRKLRYSPEKVPLSYVSAAESKVKAIENQIGQLRKGFATLQADIEYIATEWNDIYKWIGEAEELISQDQALTNKMRGAANTARKLRKSISGEMRTVKKQLRELQRLRRAA